MTRWIGITLGDVTGIGPEVTLKALAAEPAIDETRYLLIGDEGHLQQLNEKLGTRVIKQQGNYSSPNRLPKRCRKTCLLDHPPPPTPPLPH
jgi:4-hydroxy-L-threonine phosphate dehydrogenase PdxA